MAERKCDYGVCPKCRTWKMDLIVYSDWQPTMHCLGCMRTIDKCWC